MSSTKVYSKRLDRSSGKATMTQLNHAGLCWDEAQDAVVDPCHGLRSQLQVVHASHLEP